MLNGEPRLCSGLNLPIPQNGPKPLNAEVTLTNQNFDEVFPATNWITTGNSNGKWDNDDYRYVSANCAAWPARSLRDPNSSVNDYFDNMDTRMTYGPFNLQDASEAYVRFWLWRLVADTNDKLTVDVSVNGSTWTTLATYNTTDMVWRLLTISLNGYVGNSTVYVSWRFVSNASGVADGPWVDDVAIWKVVPNTPTPTATRTRTATPTRTPTITPTRTNTPIDFLTRLKGMAFGDYPRVVVVLSNQVYTITRSTTSPCNITGAVVRDPYLYSYLTDAIKQGAMVVIRIYPSPGNFTDWASPGPNHTLLAGMTPAGGDYCNENFNNYRAIDDIAAEMNAIYQINTNLTNNWPASRFFFEPANEPNKEWYDDLAKINPNLYPQIDRDTAWQAMDAYFSALYDNAKSFNSNLQILTPPMAQGLKAETREFPECNLTTLFVNDQPTNASGYDFMQNTYQTKNDGWSWHNYWRSGVEFWQGSLCQPSTTVSDHVFQYFPTWLQDFILQSTKPSFITEADLLSPCPSQSHVIVNKDIMSNNAQESIWRFIDQEQGADYVAMWLLTNQYGDPPAPSSGQNVNCADGNSEIAWHEAYRDTPLSGVYERDWFPLWWLRNEASP